MNFKTLTKYKKQISELDEKFYIVLDKHLRVKDYSPEWGKDIGLEDSELFGFSISELIQDEDINEFKRELELVKSSAIKRTFYTSMKTNNESSFQLMWDVVYGVEQDCFVCRTTDVTDLIENYNLLVRSNQVAEIGTWRVDVVNNELYWSKKTLEIHGVDSSYKPNLEEAINFYVEEHREIINKAVESAIANNTSWDLELQIRKVSGEIRWIRAVGYPVIVDGKLLRLEGTFHDITDRVEREKKNFELTKRLDLSLEASNIGVWEFDILKQSIIWDDRMFDLYGVERTKETLAYEVWQNGLHPEDKQRSIDEVQEAIEGKKKFDTHFRLITPEGSVRHIKAIANLVFDKQTNEPIKMIGANWDITEQMELESKLSREKERAEAGLVAKSMFLANMSHEIRTPLNGIVGVSTLLESKLNSSEEKKLLDVLTSSSKTLLQIINDILDISKLESNKVNVVNTNFNLYKLLEEMNLLFSYQAQVKNNELNFNINDNVPKFILGDDIKLKQILINLISNALKFTDKGKVSVDLDVHDQNGLDFNLEFTVRDSGQGIDEKNLELIFDAFSQGDIGTERKFGGTGLGLNICKKLIELLNGSISVKSKKGVGSEFKFYLKFQKSEKPETIAKIESINNRNELDVTFQDKFPQNILVVDDNDMNIYIAMSLLKNLGFSPISCSDPLKVIKIIKDKGIDTLLLDCHMPVMDGYKLTELIRSTSEIEDIQIIALSATSMKEDVDKCFKFGMNFFIPKPIKFDELGLVLKKTVKKNP